MEFKNNLGEYKESIIRPTVTPQEVENVKQQIEYSNRLVKAHNVIKVLDLPDEQDNPIRKILLKQDNNTLDKLATKSQEEIQDFIINVNEKREDSISHLGNKKNEQKEELKEVLFDKNKNQITDINRGNTQDRIQTIREDKKNDEKFLKLKSLLPPSILTANSELTKNFKDLDTLSNNMLEQTTDSEKKQMKKLQDEILIFLKNPKILKSITDQLGGANKNNPQYVEFKNALLGVDTSFETYFKDLESINSGASINADEVIHGIEKDSGGMIELDLNSNIPMSKMSLIGSSYSFDEEIDKKAFSEIMGEGEKELADVQNSEAVLKGLYKPFGGLWQNIKANLGKESSKEKINESVSNFSRNIFSELDEVYEKTGIKSDIQIKESDIASFTDIKTEDDLKSKFENIREKLEKIIARISEFRTWIINKYRTEINNVLSLKSEQKEKEFEVLNFMRSSGFDLIPKEISDKVIREVQGGTLKIPGLDLNVKNIDLKNGNFGEDSIHKGEGLNIHSKTNMVKFMNKLISGDINNPLAVESIANGKTTVDSSSMQSQFLEAGIVDSIGWREGKITENLTKASVEKTA